MPENCLGHILTSRGAENHGGVVQKNHFPRPSPDSGFGTSAAHNVFKSLESPSSKSRGLTVKCRDAHNDFVREQRNPLHGFPVIVL